MGTYVSAGHVRGHNWNQQPTTTTFRTWCQYVKDALTGCGLVQTSDTGQLDPATVNLPGSLNTDAGYLIYRFSDAQQGADPIFLKFILGRAGNHLLRLSFQVGQGSNGSGTLTGTTHGPFFAGLVYTTSGSYDPLCTDYAYHGDGVFWLALQAVPVGINSPPRHWLAVSRLRNQSTEAFDGRGVNVITCSNDPDSRASGFTLFWTGGCPNAGGFTFDMCLIVGNNSTGDAGERLSFPHFYITLAGVVEREWAWWTTGGGNLSSGVNTFTANPLGTSRLWLGLGDANGRAMRGTGFPGTTTALVLPWE